MSTEEPKAVVQLAGDDLFVGFSPSGHAVTIDTDRARNSAPSPMELLLLALGSCTGVESYRRIEVHHIVTGRNISERSVAQAIELSEQKYCSVAATLRPTAEIVSSFEIIEG